MGKQLIGTSLGGLPEILNEELGHMQFAAGSAKALAERITSVWNSREKSLADGARIRSDYLTRFTQEVHLREYLRNV